MSYLSQVAQNLKKVLDVNRAIFSNPGTAFSKGIKSAIAKSEAQTPKENIKQIAKNTAIAGLTIAGAGTQTGKKILSSLVPTTAKGAIITGGATIVGANVLKSSERARSAVVSAPSSIASFSQNVGNIIDDPSIQNVKQTIKDNPVLSIGTVGAVVGGVGYALAPVIASTRQTEAIQEQTEALQSSYPSNIQIPQYGAPQPQIIQIQQLPAPIPTAPTVQEAPTTTAVAPVGAPKPKKKRKKRKKTTKKKKKKTRRSPKKKRKTKKKSIKRRKS